MVAIVGNERLKRGLFKTVLSKYVLEGEAYLKLLKRKMIKNPSKHHVLWRARLLPSRGCARLPDIFILAQPRRGRSLALHPCLVLRVVSDMVFKNTHLDQRSQYETSEQINVL